MIDPFPIILRSVSGRNSTIMHAVNPEAIHRNQNTALQRGIYSINQTPSETSEVTHLQPNESARAPPKTGPIAGPIFKKSSVRTKRRLMDCGLVLTRGTAPYTPKKPALSEGGAMSPIIPEPMFIVSTYVPPYNAIPGPGKCDIFVLTQYNCRSRPSSLHTPQHQK